MDIQNILSNVAENNSITENIIIMYVTYHMSEEEIAKELQISQQMVEEIIEILHKPCHIDSFAIIELQTEEYSTLEKMK